MSSMQKTDEELVRSAARGDTDAFNELVARWEVPIHALAYRVLGRDEDARDVCQEAFLRAFRGLSRFKGQAKFSSWLYRIALNLCNDRLRRERRVGFVQPQDDFESTDRAAVDQVDDPRGQRLAGSQTVLGHGRQGGRETRRHGDVVVANDRYVPGNVLSRALQGADRAHGDHVVAREHAVEALRRRGDEARCRPITAVVVDRGRHLAHARDAASARFGLEAAPPLPLLGALEVAKEHQIPAADFVQARRRQLAAGRITPGLLGARLAGSASQFPMSRIQWPRVGQRSPAPGDRILN